MGEICRNCGVRLLAAAVVVAAVGEVGAEVFEDFEGRDYGNWTSTGTAFGPGPARGGFGGQHTVSGFSGKGLVNTYRKGDSALGTLTSPEFLITKSYVNFLIGGGRHPGKTCIELIVDGRVVRTETGGNDERLVSSGWDVREFVGKRGRLVIADRQQGPWGHVNVDQISFDDSSLKPKTVETTVTPSGRFWGVPVDNAGLAAVVEVFDGETRLLSHSIQWATGGVTNWMASLDLGEAAKRPLTFRFTGPRADEFLRSALAFSDRRFPLPVGTGDEPYRPQLCFTPPSGWNNDVNGLSYNNGEWHLFYQHNPYGIAWGNMHWGHAVSKDLVHWRDLGDALVPDDTGTMYSGSAVTDSEGRAGFGKGAHLLFYTAAGDRIVAPRGSPVPRTQRIAWSTDGRTYTKVAKPAVMPCPEANRDPKVVWHAPSGTWAMVVYGNAERDYHTYAFYSSKDLLNWEKASVFRGDKKKQGSFCFECPDFFELPIEGEDGRRWVLADAHGTCVVGRFDGKEFAAEAEPFEFVRKMGRSAYAWQTFSDVPDGRCINMGWAHYETRTEHADACFNQGMTLPMEVRLVRTHDGLRLARFPVRELQTLRQGNPTSLKQFSGELAEVEFSCVPTRAATVSLDLRGVKIVYNAHHRILSVNGQPTAWDLDAEGRLGLRVFVDRVGVEILSLDGLQYLPLPDVAATATSRKMSWSASGAKEPVGNVIERVWRLAR